MISILIRHRLLAALALGLVMTALAITGCKTIASSTVNQTGSLFRLNTLVKQYVTAPDDDPPVDTAGGYEISLIMQAVRSRDLEGTDSFRITVNSKYLDKVKSRLLPSTPALKLDSLRIRPYRLVVSGHLDDLSNLPGLVLSLPMTGFHFLMTPGGSYIHPSVIATDFEKRRSEPEVYRGRLVGPSYRYDLFAIPDRYVGIELSYVARLVDRSSGAEIERVEITRALHRVHKLKYY